MTSTQIIAIVIFLVTMAAIMTEKLHRTVAAVAGALLLILCIAVGLSVTGFCRWNPAFPMWTSTPWGS